MNPGIPDTEFRKRDKEFAEQERFKAKQKTETRKGFARDNFRYDKGTDTYTCPNGEKLKPSPNLHKVGDFQYRQYRTRHTGCRGCKHHKRCHANSRARSIYISSVQSKPDCSRRAETEYVLR